MTRRAVIALVPLLAAAACDRTHMRASFGRDARAAFAAQIVNPQAGNAANPSLGLDPEETAIVLDTYRKSLSPNAQAEGANRTPVLVLPAQPQQQAAAPPPVGAP